MVRMRIALTLPLLAASVLAQSELSGTRPNILFIFSDDHAAHAISAYGSKINKTPNIDRIAAGGVLFRNNFCGNSICGPSRATILTGKHSHSNGFMRNGNTFDPAQPTMPKMLQAAGYQTAMIGKWHLQSAPRGFDHWIVLPGQGQYYNPDFKTPEGRKRIEGHATNITTDLAVEWLDGRNPDKPFLLMCQHKAPHRNWMPAPEDLELFAGEDLPVPPTLFDDYEGRTAAAQAQEMTLVRHMYLHYDLVVPPTEAARAAGLKGPDRSWDNMMKRLTPEQRKKWDAAFGAENRAFLANEPQGRDRLLWYYQRYIKNYLRCINGVDRSVGRLLDWLDRHPEVKRNTIVIYSSDQGFYLGDHGWYDKRWMYEESFRMPLVMQWPGRLPAGKEVGELAQNIDFAPTFLDLAGLDTPGDMHGTSLVPLLGEEAPTDWRDALYYHYYESHAVHMVPAHYGVRTARYKLIRYYEPQWDEYELFDLEKDPDELRNAYEDPAYASVVVDLKRRLAELREQYGDDTGTLGDFDVTAGIARVVHEGQGLRVWANTAGGYLLEAGKPAGTKFSTTMTPVRGRQRTNGFVIASGGDPRRDLVRAGVEFQNKQLTIIGPGGFRKRKSVPIEWDGGPVEITMHVDLEERQVVASAAGKQLRVPLPPNWQELTAYGYGAGNAETIFTPLRIE